MNKGFLFCLFVAKNRIDQNIKGDEIMNAKLNQIIKTLPEDLQKIAKDAIFEETELAYYQGKKDGKLFAWGEKLKSHK